MLEKLKKYKFLIGIILISLIYIILTSVQNPNFAYEANDDDYFVLSSAESILNSKWLGSFSAKTLSKGPGAPIYLAIVNFIRNNVYTRSFFTLFRWCNFTCLCFEKGHKK